MGRRPGAVAEYQLRWAGTHQEQKRRNYLVWSRENPDKIREYASRRRATLRQAIIEPISRAIIWLKDGGICYICHLPVDPDDWHLEHVVALVNGGSHTYSNLRVSHPHCNLVKGTKEAPHY